MQFLYVKALFAPETWEIPVVKIFIPLCNIMLSKNRNNMFTEMLQM